MNNRKIEKAFHDWLSKGIQNQDNLAVTLTLSQSAVSNKPGHYKGNKVTTFEAQKSVNQLLNRLNRKYYGGNWKRNFEKKNGNYLKVIPAYHKENHLHIHLLLTIPQTHRVLNPRATIAQDITDAWLKTDLGLWNIDIKPIYSNDGWLSYMLAEKVYELDANNNFKNNFLNIDIENTYL